jgi:hypothetical protein
MMISNQPQVEVISKQITQPDVPQQNVDPIPQQNQIRLNETFGQNGSSLNYLTIILLIIIIILLGLLIYQKKLNK